MDNMDADEVISHLRELILRMTPGPLRDVLYAVCEAYDAGRIAWMRFALMGHMPGDEWY